MARFRFLSPWFLCAFLAGSLQGAKPAAAPAPPLADPARAAEIARLLPEQPAAPGHPISDRAAWSRFASAAVRATLIRQAEQTLKTPLPETTDDLFLDFSKTGNRTHWQDVAGHRRGRLQELVLAECIENQGRFLPAFHELARSLCAERTWVMPAHDTKLGNFHGKFITIDLGSSDLAWQLAVALSLLGDRVEPDVRELVRSRIQAWVLDPAKLGITGRGKEQSWMRATHNWNAVCTAGVTGAALTLLPSREERAIFVAAAEASCRYFLSGFTPDGYCSEGLGYWNYGFGRFILLTESIAQATGGKLNLLAAPQAKAPAQFPRNLHLQHGVYPAFADCSVNARPDSTLMYFINRCLQMGWAEHNDLPKAGATGGLPEDVLLGFPNSASTKPVPPPHPDAQLRAWFPDAGILISRPAPGSAGQFAVALKGGHNAEHHNHNDLGSYVAVAGKTALLLDPGAEVYTARTFSKDRYLSQVLSSYGHAVPLVAGMQQSPGRQAEAKILQTTFSAASDILALDLTSAYPVPGLKRLVRTFVYSRDGKGALTVRDEVQLDQPATFETALITLDTWTQPSSGQLRIEGKDAALRVAIDTGGKAYAVSGEELREDVHTRSLPKRIAIRLEQPVTEATISVVIQPDAGK